MKTLAAIAAIALVIGIIVYTRRSSHPATRDLARDVCENIVDRCGSLADPALAPKIPNTGSCIRWADSELQSGGLTEPLATCMADGDSCEAVVGCGLTEGVRQLREKRSR